MKNLESKLQQECVRWFRYAYPNLILFAIPNGGHRNIMTATTLKKEGVLAGVADLFLSCPHYGNFVQGTFKHGLYIEMKIDKGKQTEAQLGFQQAVEAVNYQYNVCRSFDEFKQIIESYIK